MNGDARTLCQNCLTQLEAALQNNREQKRAKKSNLVPGLVGAFLGALIGVVLWVLAGKLGYINIISWVTIIMDFCALKGYEKFGGSLDLKGLIGSLVIVFVLIYFANRLATAWIVYDALKEMGWSFSDCFQQLNMIMDLSGVTNLYYRDLAVGYGMTVVFGIFPAIGLFRTSRGEYTIR